MIRKQQNCQIRSLKQNRTLRLLTKGLVISGAALTVLVLSTKPVHAYIDPGTGSMIIQAIAAAVLTAGAMLGVFWRSVKNFFMNLGSRSKQDAADKDQPEDTNKENKQDGHEG